MLEIQVYGLCDTGYSTESRDPFGRSRLSVLRPKGHIKVNPAQVTYLRRITLPTEFELVEEIIVTGWIFKSIEIESRAKVTNSKMFGVIMLSDGKFLYCSEEDLLKIEEGLEEINSKSEVDIGTCGNVTINQ